SALLFDAGGLTDARRGAGFGRLVRRCALAGLDHRVELARVRGHIDGVERAPSLYVLVGQTNGVATPPHGVGTGNASRDSHRAARAADRPVVSPPDGVLQRRALSLWSGNDRNLRFHGAGASRRRIPARRDPT